MPALEKLKLLLPSKAGVPLNTEVDWYWWNAGVKVNSDFLKTAIPAGLMYMDEMSPPSAPKAPPIPSVLAVPPNVLWEYRRASTSFCAVAGSVAQAINREKSVHLFMV